MGIRVSQKQIGKFTRKTLAVILAGVFLSSNTLGWAKEERLFLTGMGNNTFSSSPAVKNSKLMQRSSFSSENDDEFRNSLTVAAICEYIEHDGNLNDSSRLKDVLTRLDADRNPNITVLPYEIIIKIPSEELTIRYFDPTKANVVSPYSDISKLSTKVIGPRLNRQIICRIKALPSDTKGPLIMLQNTEAREFVKSSLEFSYGQYGIGKDIPEKIVGILSQFWQDPDIAIEKVYEFTGKPGTPQYLFDEVYIERYKKRIKPRIYIKFIGRYISAGVVADLGCGNNLLGECIVQGRDDIKVIGVDVLDYKYKPKNSKVEFRLQKPGERIPIEDGTVDTVILSRMIHHIEEADMPVFLAEVYRILKDNGKVIVLDDTYSENIVPTYNPDNLLEKFLAIEPKKRNIALWIIDWIGGVLIPGDIGMYHPFNLKSIEDWEETFRQNGFIVRKKEFIGFEGWFHLNPQGLLILEKFAINNDYQMTLRQNMTEYISKNKTIFQDMISEEKQDVLLRIPIEAIESIGIGNIKKFLATFQKIPNIYIELYYMSGIGEVSKNVYQKYGLTKKSIPQGFVKNRGNTITLFPALRGEELTPGDILNRLGQIGLDPTKTILSPIGLQHDPVGLIRGTILGLRLTYISRQRENIDYEFVRETVNQLKELCGDDKFNLTAGDMIEIATGDINKTIKALKKLIKLLPVTPIIEEDLKQIYKHASQVLTSA